MDEFVVAICSQRSAKTILLCHRKNKSFIIVQMTKSRDLPALHSCLHAGPNLPLKLIPYYSPMDSYASITMVLYMCPVHFRPLAYVIINIFPHQNATFTSQFI